MWDGLGHVGLRRLDAVLLGGAMRIVVDKNTTNSKKKRSAFLNFTLNNLNKGDQVISPCV